MKKTRIFSAAASIVFLLGLCLMPGEAFGQVFRSTGSESGLRMWTPTGNDWWLSPGTGRLDIVANGNNAAPVASYLTNGNLGIGTTSPGYGMEVVNTAGAHLSTTTTAGYGFYLNSAGNVGIGTTVPGASLEVQGGPIKATGGLIIQVLPSDPPSPVTGQLWLISP